ncbi:hypothetical protein [Fulvivirga ligni]|uniref:hypothetical protein n=1 Tax=Fulvivirga ligni TaxID=2904246 RepID=UPI001F2F26A0|nr:hypothetical protein [Fulvivirga ligni]UII22695.1 hypothetical protein LVD16_05580 [Fulvivirga ligni]
MNITDDHIALLGAIHDAEGQSLSVAEFSKKENLPYAAINQLMQELESFDLVETEEEAGVFYLTTYGYEYVENYDRGGVAKRKKEVFQDFDQLNDAVEKIGSSKAMRYTSFWLFGFAIIFTLALVFMPDLFSPDKPDIPDLNLENIQQQVDSIRTSDSLNIPNE